MSDTSAGPRLLGPAEVRRSPPSSTCARPSSAARTSSSTPTPCAGSCASRGIDRRRRRARGRARSRLADAGAARGRRPGGRGRDRRPARRPRCPPRSPTYAPEQVGPLRGRARRRDADRPSSPARRRPRWSPTCPTTSRCRCCSTCSRCSRRLERGLVMVQAEVADRLAAAARLQGVRRPVGQGRLVRRRAPRRARSAATSSGRPPTSTPAWSPGPAATRRTPPPPAKQVFAVIDAAFAHRRKALRGALRALAGSAEAADAALEHAGRRPDGPRRVARRRATSPGSPRGWPDESAKAAADVVRHGARARQDQPAPRRRRAARRRLPPAGHRLPGDRPVRRPHRQRRPTSGRSSVERRRLHRRRRRPARRRQHRRPRRAPARRPPRPGAAGRGRTSPRRSRSPVGWPAARPTPPRRWSPSTGSGTPDTTDDDLLALAAQLGSDVPFALVGGTALGTGRGELVDARRRRRAPGGGWPCRPATASRRRRSTATSTCCSPTPRRPRRGRTPCSTRSRAATRCGLAARAAQRPPGAGLRPAPRPRRLIERGEARGRPARHRLRLRPDLRLPVRLRRPRPRRRRRPSDAGRAGHDVVLVANGPVAGAHVVEYA